ncbi:MAG: protein kinase [Polyangiaceae bacterium]|nr:protein kinase [Polyangiaceae bacterium]
MTLACGQLVDRYRIEALLGEGGMGAVYRAFDPRLERMVALKILRPRTDGPTGGVSQVLREARAAAALSHPGAVTIHDVGDAGGLAFISMELVEGTPLRARLAAGDADLATRLGWLVDVARVLAEAHRVGLVHRDVKPENVMVRADGSIKVLDFGIAQRLRAAVDPGAPTLDSASAILTATQEAVVAGTPAYMSPEHLRNGTLDGRSDQFAWGVMAFEVLAGAPPWPTRDQVELIAAILMDPAPRLSARAPEVGPRVSEVVERALSKSPDDRFPSMDALLLALDGKGPVAARRPRLPRGWAPMALTAALAGGVGLGAWWVGRAAPRTSASALPATPSASSARAPADSLSGCSPAARRAHADGLAALRQVGWDVAQHAFEAAIAADPTCAAPRLRLALMGPGLSMSSARVRATFHDAARLSARLTAPERALLEAAEPCIARDPPDRPACAARAAVVAEEARDDAELLVWAADLAKSDPRHDAWLLRALALDPGYADAWQGLAIARITAGDAAGASDALDRCTASAPASTDCRFERVRMDLRRGDCAAAERRARDWTARAPDQAFPRMFLANALAANGEPRGVVEEALRLRWRSLEEEHRAFLSALEAAQVSAWFGELDEARARLSAVTAEVGEGDYARRAELAVFTARLAVEQGRTRDAERAATAFLEGARVWSYPTVQTAYAWPSVPTAVPALLALLRDAGGVSEAAHRAKLAEWSDDARATGRVSGLLAFALGPASLASTREEAEAALATAPAPLAPLRIDLDGAVVRGAIGLLLARAGRDEAALAYLTLAARDCTPLLDPFAAVRARDALGAALEQRGDTAGACAEYGAVLSRWGKSRGRTADHARRRARALGCK